MVVKGVPAFLLKLHRLLDDAPSSVIRWDPSGDSFLVVNADVLASTVLPDYFKHANFSSFLRQLNMYNFTKQPQQQRPGSRRHQQHWRFSHADFKRGRLDLLPRIHRKTFGPGSCHTVESLTAALEQVQAGCSEAKDGLDELQATATLLRSQHQFLQEHQAATSTHVTEVHNNVELLVQMLSRLCGFDPAQHFSTTTAPLTGMPPPPSLLAPWCTISSAPPSPAHSEQDSVGSPAGATDSGLEDNVGDDEELMLVKTEPGLDLDDELFGLEGDSMACLLHWPSDQHVH